MTLIMQTTIVLLALAGWALRPGNRVAPAAQQAPHPLQIAYCMELLALTMASGAPAAHAIDAVAATAPGRAADELRRVSAATQWGVDGFRAWSAAPRYWEPAGRAFNVANRAGAAPSALLRAAAKDVRTAETARVQTAAAKAGVRVVLPLGACFLPAFILLTIVPLVLGMVRL